jgi:hypothetical protein
MRKASHTRLIPGAVLSGLDFSDTRITGKDISGANLEGADFSRAVIKHCNFTDTNLDGANFTQANMYSTQFTGAKITFASLAYTELRSVTFSGADLTGTWWGPHSHTPTPHGWISIPSPELTNKGVGMLVLSIDSIKKLATRANCDLELASSIYAMHKDMAPADLQELLISLVIANNNRALVA